MRKLKVGHIISAIILVISIIAGVVSFFYALKLSFSEEETDYSVCNYIAEGVVTEGNTEEDLSNGDYSITVEYYIDYKNSEEYIDEYEHDEVHILQTDYPASILEGRYIEVFYNPDDTSEAIIDPPANPVNSVSRRFFIAFLVALAFCVVSLIMSIVFAVLLWRAKSKQKR